MVGHLLLTVFSPILYLHIVYSAITAQQMLEAVSQFSSDFGWPRINDVAAQVNYTAFAPDIIGRVDVTNSYEGRELNTEYLFGFFASLGNSNTTRLIGVPMNGSTTELAITPPVVSFVNVREFDWGPVKAPVQVNVWFLFDNVTGLISEYDITIVRLAWLTAYVKPFIKPQLVEELGSLADKPDDVDDLIHLRAAIDICQEHEVYCLGAYQQYKSTQECVDYIYHGMPLGEVYEWGGNNAMCRYIHKAMIRYRPHVHCPHISPSGGGMCIERDYITETTQKLYPIPFIPATLG